MSNLPRFGYRRFNHYEEFEKFINLVRHLDWTLHSWQDVGGRDGIDIRAIFAQDMNGVIRNALPTVD